MSGLTPANNERFFSLLNEAVIKNTFRPRPHEESKMTASRIIRCSPEIEGDSQLAIVLFCGMAHVLYNVPKNEILDYLGVDANEFNYKVQKFKNNMADAASVPKKITGDAFDVISGQQIDLMKLRNKVILVNSYIKFYADKYNVVFKKTRNV